MAANDKDATSDVNEEEPKASSQATGEKPKKGKAWYARRRRRRLGGNEESDTDGERP